MYSPGVLHPGTLRYNCTEFIPNTVWPTWLRRLASGHSTCNIQYTMYMYFGIRIYMYLLVFINVCTCAEIQQVKSLWKLNGNREFSCFILLAF